jgi:hypothetical protein
MSPVLQEKIPPGHYLADVVVRPTEPEQVPVILKVAFDQDVPVTPRGAGTGNYGQATPFDGGILLDLRDLRSITVNDGGTITADAGAPLTGIDKVARATGRDIWIFPSTKGSTVGGCRDALHPHLRRHRDPRRRRDPDGPGAGLERALRGLRHLRRARRRPPHPPRPAGTPPPGLR